MPIFEFSSLKLTPSTLQVPDRLLTQTLWPEIWVVHSLSCSNISPFLSLFTLIPTQLSSINLNYFFNSNSRLTDFKRILLNQNEAKSCTIKTKRMYYNWVQLNQILPNSKIIILYGNHITTHSNQTQIIEITLVLLTQNVINVSQILIKIKIWFF